MVFVVLNVFIAILQKYFSIVHDKAVEEDDLVQRSLSQRSISETRFVQIANITPLYPFVFTHHTQRCHFPPWNVQECSHVSWVGLWKWCGTNQWSIIRQTRIKGREYHMHNFIWHPTEIPKIWRGWPHFVCRGTFSAPILKWIHVCMPDRSTRVYFL